MMMLKHDDNGINQKLMEMWLAAIVHHPLKYYKYNLKLYNNKIIIQYFFNWVLMRVMDDEVSSLVLLLPLWKFPGDSVIP
jgi:hypothetical protein